MKTGQLKIGDRVSDGRCNSTVVELDPTDRNKVKVVYDGQTIGAWVLDYWLRPEIENAPLFNPEGHVGD